MNCGRKPGTDEIANESRIALLFGKINRWRGAKRFALQAEYAPRILGGAEMCAHASDHDENVAGLRALERGRFGHVFQEAHAADNGRWRDRCTVSLIIQGHVA